MDFSQLIACGLRENLGEWTSFLTLNLYDPRLLILIYQFVTEFPPIEIFTFTIEELDELFFNETIGEFKTPIFNYLCRLATEESGTITLYYLRNFYSNKGIYSELPINKKLSYINFLKEESKRLKFPELFEIIKSGSSGETYFLSRVIFRHQLDGDRKNEYIKPDFNYINFVDDENDDGMICLYYLLRGAYWRKVK